MVDVNSLFSLEGRTALVTGGSSGIGYMIAEGFIAQGAKVFICSRKAEACAATAEALGERCEAISKNLSAVEGCRELAEEISARSGSLDILVNNAGVAWGAEFENFPERGWDRVMDLNLKAPFFLSQALYSLLAAAASAERPAKIINVGSIDGLRLNGWETYSYHASKAALLHLTRRMAARLVRDHIHVTAIAPGAFPSNMNRAARDHQDIVAQAIPSGRVGRSEDIAAAAIYLASRGGDYIVGHTLTVDGGLVNAELGASIDA